MLIFPHHFPQVFPRSKSFQNTIRKFLDFPAVCFRKFLDINKRKLKKRKTNGKFFFIVSKAFSNYKKLIVRETFRSSHDVHLFRILIKLSRSMSSTECDFHIKSLLTNCRKFINRDVLSTTPIRDITFDLLLYTFFSSLFSHLYIFFPRMIMKKRRYEW